VIGTDMAQTRSREASEGAGASHVPVLASVVLRLFKEMSPSGTGPVWIVDGTVGLGGHAEVILDGIPRARVLGFDQDPEALEIAQEKLARFGDRARIRRGRLSQLSRLVHEERAEPVLGMLFDLGVSSLQLDRGTRGFSFQADGPLDMRMDPSRDRTAADIVNSWDESDLADLFYYEGGETRARPIARAITEARRHAPFLRTGALADHITSAAGPAGRTAKIHPATRVFQALRRAVNEEGEELIAGLSAAERLLRPGGRLVVLSFHSGEDREVKRFFAQGGREERWNVLTRKPIESEESECRRNPRARSAKLRAAERAAAERSAGGKEAGP
jgi:16S rRNA (cytosine1402-N4)-methyltransferase